MVAQELKSSASAAQVRRFKSQSDIGEIHGCHYGMSGIQAELPGFTGEHDVVYIYRFQLGLYSTASLLH